ncbi:hypothetical protein BU16DRAFT_561648 [Lophium mytilinum]|uniref:Uncharacterized protein n=1 Tax=Lophium mytilinum TaxID=390894 RepID=A0A6A6QT65_9PEZI|nr:hypothetical protein BU16DRAFT_561648 [Lophium mytilinum]
MEHSSQLLQHELAGSLQTSTGRSKSLPENPSSVSLLGPTENPTNTSHRTSFRIGDSTQTSSSNESGIPGDEEKEPRKKSEAMSWWWWWEIGAAMLGTISMLLIIAVLFKVQDKPLQDWTLSIQPNSLIAVFTTIGKTATMVPIASCIAQLKWRHFDRRDRRLDHLQLFEDASRGPWGAVTMMYSVRYQAWLASALALVTVVALGIEPSAQQILNFPHRITMLKNASAEIGIADGYSSKAYDVFDAIGSDAVGFEDIWALQNHLIGGMAGTVLQPRVECASPATQCSWEDFTTLGVCSNFRNVTDVAIRNCNTNGTRLSCTYSFPGREPYDDQDLSIGWLTTAYSSTASTGFRSATGVADESNQSGAIGSMAAVKVTAITEHEALGPPKTEVYYSTWYWCAQTYHGVTATPNALHTSPPQTERLFVMNNPPGKDVADNTLRANSTGKLYKIGGLAQELVFWYLENALNTTTPSLYNPAYFNLNVGYLLQSNNISNVTQNIADTLRGLMRSDTAGDNRNVTMLKGEAFYNTTFVEVRWPWIILPLAETLLTVVLLAISIALTRQQPLLKTSVMAFLVHGLEGWSDDELAVGRPETAESLHGMAKGMTASFRENGRGRLKFVRS